MRPLPPRPEAAPSDAEPPAETEPQDPGHDAGHDPGHDAELPERRWHYRRSLASRVTLLTTIAVGVAVAFLSLSVYFVVRIQLEDTMDEQLLDRATSMAAGLTSAAADKDRDQLLTQLRFLPRDSRVQILFADGSILLTNGTTTLPLGEEEWDVATSDADHAVLRSVTIAGDHVRMATVPMDLSNGRIGALVMTQNTDSQQKFLGKLGLVMLGFGGTGVIIAAVAGTVVARNGLRPVRRLTESVETIARTEELTPLRVEGDDEIARLATAFNQMLTALSASRERQKQLVADAGHELKTPLTSLRTNLDLLAQAEDTGAALSPETRRELIDDVRAQIVELSTLIGDLVELARDEQVRHVVEPVSLVEVLDKAVSRVRLRAPSVTFEVRAAPWWLVGESHSLERAITNLLDNAAKWSPTDGRVVATLANGILTVDDEGPGIPEADREYVFERFFRSTESRAMPGSGLGLAIVRQVAERHAGSVRAGVSPSGGARLTMTLPGGPLHPDATRPIPREPRGATTAPTG
ncbi:sensor histidine kinase [Nocardioides zeae]|uniref:histidine kinase n=1 Tax=Nocardioides zeae TaxID=1457234 RepID=A0A6P0HMM5_9ACTN|nr:HAMP domain-containing sensor histidine kinase [Nocardioides zeae]NEN79846.1 HAMP domain-containing histidine kinase [Nocardioides zeae]